jgi:5-methylcytosine-specific restriction endonuclease McrA
MLKRSQNKKRTILKLDIAGNPVGWIAPKKAVKYYFKDLVAHDSGEQIYHFSGGVQRLTQETISFDVSSIISVKGKVHFNDREFNRVKNSILFGRDLYTCAYCGGVFTSGFLSRDHIVPISKKGKDTWKNVITACVKCNNKKDDRTPEEAGMQLRFQPYTPSFIERFILESIVDRKIFPSQRDYLLKRLDENSRVRQLFDL